MGRFLMSEVPPVANASSVGKRARCRRSFRAPQFPEERETRALNTSHQQPEVNYLPRFSPQLISLEE